MHQPGNGEIALVAATLQEGLRNIRLLAAGETATYQDPHRTSLDGRRRAALVELEWAERYDPNPLRSLSSAARVLGLSDCELRENIAFDLAELKSRFNINNGGRT